MFVSPLIYFWCSPEGVLLVAAVREDDFSREPARIIRGKKYGHARDVLGLADAAQRRTRDYLLLELRSHDTRRVRTLRFGCTGIESANADFSGANSFESTRLKPLASDPMLIMQPPSALKAGKAASIMRNMPSTFVLN